jgi:hypothetical protein
MILKTDTMRVDVDQVSLMHDESNIVIVGGFQFSLPNKDWEILSKAFDQLHQSHMYDENLKKVRGK